MDLLIILCFVYALYRASLDAAVNSYALSRGRDVYIGDGDNRRHYSGWTLGAALAVLGLSFLEGWKTGWHWGGRKRDEIKARRAGRPQPAVDGPEVLEPDAAPWDGDGPAAHEPPPARPDPPQSPPPDEPPGPARCLACGRVGTVADPVVSAADGIPVHRSHTLDPRSGYYQPPAPPVVDVPADVVDGSGRPVDAVWEPPAAARQLDAPTGWPSVHTTTRPPG
jgi:hypothetical protein